MDKSNVIGLVSDTGWYDFLELNRMAFSDVLPRNSESRALGVALRMIRKTYPHIEWVVSFADACQCGDGAIYRASGFILTKIRPNKDVLRFPDGTIGHKMSQVTGKDRLKHFANNGGKWSGSGEALPGFMMRYLYFLNPAARARLTVPEVPFSEIAEKNAGMYKGKPIERGKQAMAGSNLNSGGAAPTAPLQSDQTATAPGLSPAIA